ncbi:hypothetical protein KFK09_004282 [Dendrobium nobile]|uniref:Uncharacterized protein n=1 Tax=Dendrobium nobile TaxID=94219 RepID=A0A8T3BZY0_DENNO|nr:hypothetical protein KFK09_004282 [Dendrobium nobile]
MGTYNILEPVADVVEPIGQSRVLGHRRLPSSWARGLVEFWDSGSGTCWNGTEELMITLSDLRTVPGLPIFGHHFEECVPPDEQLFQRVLSVDGDKRGRLVLPDVYQFPAYFSERGYPTVLLLSQASSTLESERIRLFFFAPQLVRDQFSFIHQQYVVGLSPHLRDTIIVDGIDHRGRCILLLCGQSLIVDEYLISIRPGWLCYRSGNILMLEGYQPNRVARQFGYSQAIDFEGRPVVLGAIDVLCMETVLQETRFFTVAVRLSFGSTMEHGARRYESCVHDLRLPRRHSSSRDFSDLTFERGIDTEAHTATGVVVPSSPRASDVTLEPPHIETTKPLHRRARSQCTLSSRMFVDIHTLLGDSDFTSYSTLDPPNDFSFLVYPYGSFCPGESSGAGVGFLFEFLETPLYTPAALDLVLVEFSFFPECPQTNAAGPSFIPAGYSTDSVSPSIVLEGVDYTSKILCHVPLPLSLRSVERCSQIIELLRDLISSIDPRSPESWIEFVPTAD